jgi:hypothetical protein
MFNKKMHDYFSSLVDPSEFNAPPEPRDPAESLADSIAPASSRLVPLPAQRPAAGAPAPVGLEIGPAMREGDIQPQLRPAEQTRTMTITGPPPPMRVQAPAPLINGEQDEGSSRVPLILTLVLVGLAVAAGVMYLGMKFLGVR